MAKRKIKTFCTFYFLAKKGNYVDLLFHIKYR